MQTRLSTGTLVMNGTSTVKEKDIRTPPGTPTPDTLKSKKGYHSNGLSSFSFVDTSLDVNKRSLGDLIGCE